MTYPLDLEGREAKREQLIHRAMETWRPLDAEKSG